jgi:SAM-dependent methyltransferase
MSFTPGSSPYDPFASIYSRWMGEDFCRRTWPVIERIWISRLPRAARVLDVCCGAGQIANALSQRGFGVTGIDISDQMLRLARQDAPLASFVRADVRSFSLPRQFHGALSTFNSIAHLKNTDELRQAFRSIRAVLVPGAPFLFDVSMEEAYTAKWRGRLLFTADDCACILEPSYDAARHIGKNRVTVLGHRQRTEFCIEQHCHREQDLRQALLSAGFTSIQAYDAERDLDMAGEWGRSFFLCS